MCSAWRKSRDRPRTSSAAASQSSRRLRPHWPLLAGEAIQNLRAALDHEIADLLAARDFVNAREKVVAVTMGSPVIDEESKKQRANATPA
jgi:hypothetical protein